MRFSESKEIHQAVLKAIFESEENKDPLYNIEDSRVFKRVLANNGLLTEYSCGNDAGLKFVLKAISDYCSYKQDENYSYDYEVKLLAKMFSVFNEYNEHWETEKDEVDKATEMQYSKDESESSTLNADKTGMKLIALKDLAFNSKSYVLKTNYCFEHFMTGTLEEPSEEDQKDAYYGLSSNTEALTAEVMKMPCFTHFPVPEDITDSIIDEVPAFELIKKTCFRDFRKLIDMFCDNDNGTIWVRLYKPENGERKPVFVKLYKLVIYMKWVLLGRHENLWTGLIKEALDVAEIDYKNLSGEELYGLCFGEEYNPEVTEDEPKDAKFYLTHFNEKSSVEYTRIVYELYLNMAATSSFHVKVEPEFYDLVITVKRLLVFLPTVIDAPKDAIRSIMDALQTQAGVYKEAYKASKEKRNIIRVDICNSFETLCTLYNSDGADSMRPYSIMKKKK